MLDGLSLRRRSAFGDGATDEEDEFLDAGPLKVAEVADIQSIRKENRVGSVRVALENQQRRDLHLSFLNFFSLKNFAILSLSL